MKIKYSFFLLIISISCKPGHDEIYKFDPRNLVENEIKLSEIAYEISYIPLDNIYPLGLIHNNFTFLENSIYFTVSYTGILEFSRNGKFIRKIGNIGRGPGEYTSYIHFGVDEEKRLIYVLDIRSKSSPIKVYSGAGDFQKGISLSESENSINTFEYYNSKFIVFNSLSYGDSKYNWIVFDTLGNIIAKRERTIPIFMSGWSGSRGTYKFGGNLSYWDTYNDTVFTILPDLKYKAALILCPGDHIVPRAHIPDPAIIKKYMMINQLFETRRFWIIIYFYKIPVLAMIDKNTREAFVYHLKIEQPVLGSRRIGGIDNDLDGGLRFLPQNYFEENGNEYMVGIIYPDQIKANVSTSEFKNSIPKYPEKKKELEKLANIMKETDNPVLMLVKLKK